MEDIKGLIINDLGFNPLKMGDFLYYFLSDKKKICFLSHRIVENKWVAVGFFRLKIQHKGLSSKGLRSKKQREK